MSDIQFEEDGGDQAPRYAFTNNALKHAKHGTSEQILVRLGIARNQRQANIIMISLCAASILIVGFVLFGRSAGTKTQPRIVFPHTYEQI